MKMHVSVRKRMLAFALAAALATMGAFALSACSQGGSSSSASSSATRTISFEGNEYKVPETVDKVAPAIGALVQVTAMVAGDDPVIAAAPTQQVSEQFKKVLTAYEKGNPNGYDTSDIEQIIQSGAQVVYGPPAMYSDEQKAQLEQANIVFIPINDLATIDGICNITEMIGELLGGDAKTKADKFSAFWKGNVDDARQRTASLSQDAKPKVLNLAYSNGAWTTEAGNALISEYIEAAGGISLSRDYTQPNSENQGGNQGRGGATVDEEQIVAWNPDYIITYSAEATEQIMGSAALATVKAVQDGHVYTSPKGLYLWSVRSGEGALMAPWVGTKINAELFSNIDMNKMVKEFFQNYYGYELSDTEIDAILAGTF